MKINKNTILRLGFLISFLLISGLLFASLAEDVTNHESMSNLDPVLGAWLLARTTLTGDKFFSLITLMGDALVISSITGLMGLWFVKEKRWNQLYLLVSTVGGAALLNYILKNIFIRPRPVFPLAYLQDSGFSFPSGHTMISTAFYGIIAFLIIPHFKSWISKTLVILGWIMISGFIGFSRLYLGVHFLTDVLAGWATGVLWLTICILGVYLFGFSNIIRNKETAIMKSG